MKITVKDMTLVALFASLTAIGAFVSLPVGPVPITLQSLFVILAGIILGPRLGALSQIVYISIGLIGLPIFSGFTGGPQSIMMPSFGFIIGFIFASYAVGLIAHSTKDISSKRVFIASLVGTIVIYLFGLPYMYYILNIVLGKGLSFKAVFDIGCLIFLPGDFIKLIISSLVGVKLLKVLPTLNSSVN